LGTGSPQLKKKAVDQKKYQVSFQELSWLEEEKRRRKKASQICNSLPSWANPIGR
jgi:hypothetical protein